MIKCGYERRYISARVLIDVIYVTTVSNNEIQLRLEIFVADKIHKRFITFYGKMRWQFVNYVQIL